MFTILAHLLSYKQDDDSPTLTTHSAFGRQVRTLRTAAGFCDPIYLVRWETRTMYGGPEEGGWHYTWTTICEVRKCWDVRSALSAAREMRQDVSFGRYGESERALHAKRGPREMHLTLHHDPCSFPVEGNDHPGVWG